MKRQWTDDIARGSIRRAAHRAPPQLAARLEEEWLADLQTRRSPFARLVFAAGCRWAARTIALEFGTPVRIAAPAAAAGPATLCERPRAPSGPPRFIFFLAIAGLHALVIHALASGMTPEVIEKLPPPLRAIFIEQPQPQPVATPTPIGPVLTVPPLVVPPPVIHINQPTDEDHLLRVAAAVPQLSQPAPAGARTVRRVIGGPGAGFPNTEDFYPENLRRLGAQGAATVGVCVDAAGRLTASPTLRQSSGTAQFDASALRLARAGSGHYRATTEDGRAVSSCYPFRVRFQIGR